MRYRTAVFSLFFVLLSQLLGERSSASARVQIDEAKGVIQVIAQLHYFGSAMTPELAQAATDEIRRMWNEPEAELVFRGRQYKTEFVITQNLNRVRRASRADCANNFIEIVSPREAADRSFYDLHGQNGRFYTSDELGVSTTAAHEFGHGLGLPHPRMDQRAASVAGIMFPRGTLVRPEFQWDVHVRAGAAGGTLRPHVRKVRPEDVRAIDLRAVQLDASGRGCIWARDEAKSAR